MEGKIQLILLRVKGFLKKETKICSLRFTGLNLFVFLLLVVFYFISRLINLTALPVFADEAIYLRWSQVMKNEETLRFLPLSDGKQPLFMWLTIPFLKLFSDPLFAGRFVSVLAGLGTMLALGALVYFLKRSVRLSLLAMFFYLFAPFTLFFDRLALVDSLLSALAIWSLFFAFLLGEKQRLDLAMILGIILGGAWLTKSPGLFLVLLTPVIVLSSYYQKEESLKLKPLLKLGGLIFVSLGFAFSAYNLLRLGPNFHLIASRNADYVWPIKEILKHPLDPLIPHLKDIYRYYTVYLTHPFFILGCLGLLKSFGSKKERFYCLAILTWWLTPLLIQSALAKVFTARYFLFGVPAFLVFIIFGWEALEKFFKKKKTKPFLLVLFLLPALYFNYCLWFRVKKAPLPKDEYAGYLEDWTAGWGIKETAVYLKNLPREKGIVVGTEGFFGTLPDGLQIYLEGEADISIIGVGYPLKALPEALIRAREYGNEVYLVVNKSRIEYPQAGDLQVVAEYPKPGGDSLLFYKL